MCLWARDNRLAVTLRENLCILPRKPVKPNNRNPTGKGGFKPGVSGNPGGMSSEQALQSQRVRALLLSPERDAKWLAAYDKALDDGVPPIILDYAHRRLGKPPESLTVTATDPLAEALRVIPPGERLRYIDALAAPKELPSEANHRSDGTP